MDIPFVLKEIMYGFLDKTKLYSCQENASGALEVKIGLNVQNAADLKIELKTNNDILITEQEKGLVLFRNPKTLNFFRPFPTSAVFENGFLTLQFENIVEELHNVTLEIR